MFAWTALGDGPILVLFSEVLDEEGSSFRRSGPCHRRRERAEQRKGPSLVVAVGGNRDRPVVTIVSVLGSSIRRERPPTKREVVGPSPTRSGCQETAYNFFAFQGVTS